MQDDIQLHRPHPNVKKVWVVQGLILTFFLSIGGAIGIGVSLGWLLKGWALLIAALLAGLVIFALLARFFVNYSRRAYDLTGHACREHDLVVCHGVWWKKRICIPRLRVQHVDIESGPIERKLGLCHLSVFTAGSTTAAASIEGLAPEQAEALRAELIAERGARNAEPPDPSLVPSSEFRFPSSPGGLPGA